MKSGLRSKTKARPLARAALFSAGALFIFQNASAWDEHGPMVPAALQKLSPQVEAALSEPIEAPCPEEDAAIYAQLIQELGLNPNSKIPPTAPEACKNKRPITGREILLGASVMDPDRGMDQNLDDSQDPDDYRQWMGGKTGETSQGFRHMFFGGWKISHPITTFQIPLHKVGYAPQRAELLAFKAREFFRKGKKAWGFRLLAWSMHFLQDLAQPFHSVQIPNPRMVPWFVLYTWPPGKAFNDLVSETRRVIANYHWAYEQYVQSRLLDQNDPTAPFADCMEQARTFSPVRFDAKNERISSLALRIAEASLELAPRLGESELGFFGNTLKDRRVDIPAGKGVPDYKDYAIRPDLTQARLELHQASCVALSNAVVGGRYLLTWTFQP